MPGPAPAPLRLAVLGQVRAAGRGGGALLPVAGLGANLLVALALEPRGLSAARVVDEVWPDRAPASGRAALQTLVSRLRAAHPGLVVSTATGYALGGDRDDVDLHRAAAAAADRTRDAADPAGTAVDVADALALWDGEPGTGATSEDLLAALRSRADGVRRDLLRLRTAALLDLADDAAVRAAEDLLALAPLDDGAHLLRMRALHAAGRTTEAVAAFAAYRERLRDALGTDPAPEVAAFHLELLDGAPAVPAARVHGLRRAPDALIGRDGDVAAVEALLAAAPVVTVLGTGGLGKTRLVQEVARRATGRYPAVHVAELAPVRDAPDVLPAVAAALRVPEPAVGRRGVAEPRLRSLPERVLDRLGEQPTLLVLDNCEQVVDEVGAWVAEVVATVPGVQVLATSRAPLGVQGERVLPLAPLPTRTADGSTAPAVQLFTERATAVRPGVVLPPDVVERLCARLDGLPLAIELAAARTRSLTVAEVERRLSDRFALLVSGAAGAPERHRTLHAVIAWSWDLLTERQRALCRRVAVLPDGFGLPVALAVRAGETTEAEVLDDLDALVAQSLLRVEDDERTGEARYRMLESVREFGQREVQEHGEAGWLRGVVLGWAREVAMTVVREAGSPERVLLDRSAAAEHDNLVAVLRSVLDDPPDEPDVAGAALALYAVVGLRWMMQGAHAELGELAPRLLDLVAHRAPAGDPEPTVLALTLVAGTHLLFGDLRTGARARLAVRRAAAGAGLRPVSRLLADALAAYPDTGRVAEVLRAAREQDDVPARRLSLFAAWSMAENDGDVAGALTYADAAYRLAVAGDDPWTRMMAASALAGLHSQALRPQEALRWVEVAEEALAAVRGGAAAVLLDDAFADNVAQTRGLALLTAGEWDAAERVFEQVAATAADVREAQLLGGVGVAEARRGRGDVAGGLAALRALATRPDVAQDQDPWLLILAGTALAAHALAGRTGDPEMEGLAEVVREAAGGTPPFGAPMTDRPVIGALLVGVAAWRAATDPGDPTALELLALAERFGARQDIPAVARAQHWARATERHGEAVVAAARAAADALPAGADVARAVDLVRRGG